MKIPFNIVLIICFFLVNLSAASAQSINLDKDLISDTEFPAVNKELLINIKGDTVTAYAMIANGKEEKATVILAHGFPGYDNNFDVAQALRRNGFNVVHFRYRGSWGSRGQFMYSHCVEDVKEIINFLTTEENSAKFRIAPEEFIILGRSYGGGVGLIAGAQVEKVKKIIAVSSANYGAILANKKSLADLGSYQRNMKKQVMINTDIDEFLQEMLDKKREFDVLTYKEELAKKKVLIIEDTDRNDEWVLKLSNIDLIKLETDHGFIDQRLEMTRKIIEWIQNN